MSRLLLNLRHVPDDEADDVRTLLDEAGIEWYETPIGRWGIGLGGIWIRDREELPRARELLRDYDRERFERARADHAERARRGELETMVHRLIQDPVGVCLRLGAVAFILFLMLYPFFGPLQG